MKIFVCLLLLSIGTLQAYPEHSRNLSSPIKLLYKFDETRNLINQVEAQGRITIKTAQMGAYAPNAAWFPDSRTICINVSQQRSLGSVVCSLVFELYNALNQRNFNHLDQLAYQGQISQDDYVESVEYQEYLHALKTAEVLQRGVAKKIFPYDAYYSVAPSFAEHFWVQQQAGHSDLIASLWQSLSRNNRN